MNDRVQKSIHSESEEEEDEEWGSPGWAIVVKALQIQRANSEGYAPSCIKNRTNHPQPLSILKKTYKKSKENKVKENFITLGYDIKGPRYSLSVSADKLAGKTLTLSSNPILLVWPYFLQNSGFYGK